MTQRTAIPPLIEKYLDALSVKKGEAKEELLIRPVPRFGGKCILELLNEGNEDLAMDVVLWWAEHNDVEIQNPFQSFTDLPFYMQDRIRLIQFIPNNDYDHFVRQPLESLEDHSILQVMNAGRAEIVEEVIEAFIKQPA